MTVSNVRHARCRILSSAVSLQPLVSEDANRAFIRSNQYGGGGGDPFADDLTEGRGISSITIRSDVYVDQVSVTYSLTNGGTRTDTHGGDGGAASMIPFAPDEYITAIKGRAGRYVDQITIVTNKRIHGYGPYGRGGGNPFEIDTSSANPLGGIFGRAARYVDAIGVFLPYAGDAAAKR
jgi:hypothetical protein